MFDKQSRLMMLSKGSYGLYPAGDILFRFNNSKVRIMQ